MIRKLPEGKDKVSYIEIHTHSQVSFAHYYQPDTEVESSYDIEWVVLTQKGGAVLLASRYAMYCKPFSSDGSTTWEQSTLRKWLNDEWIDKSFVKYGNGFMVVPTPAADPLNVRSLLPYRKVADDGLRVKTDDEDYVFLLSQSEVSEFAGGPVSAHADWHADKTQLEETHTVKWWTRPDVNNGINCVDENGQGIWCAPDSDGIFVMLAVWVDNIYIQRSFSDVTDSWKRLLKDAKRGVFNYDKFKKTASATYSILHLYYNRAKKCVAYPKSVVEMIILIARYAETSLRTECNEHLLSVNAANAFCVQSIEWTTIYRRDPENGYLGGFRNGFAMKDLNGQGIVVDAETFDMEHPLDLQKMANDGCFTL